MVETTKLSIVIVTRNEEERITQCLESVKWADEIIVVDSRSTDRTVEIAMKYTDKVFAISRDTLDANINKNYGMGKATGDWVLFLDADETIPPETKLEIRMMMRDDGGEFDGYMLLRKNLFLGKWMKHGGWWDYAANVALVRRGKGGWARGMHEKLKVNGKIGRLKNPTIHDTHRDISQWMEKTNEYTTEEAKLGRKSHMVVFPPAMFLKKYIWKRGFMDGIHGFVAAMLAAYYEFVRNAKLWEKANHMPDEKFAKRHYGDFGPWSMRRREKGMGPMKQVRSLQIFEKRASGREGAT